MSYSNSIITIGIGIAYSYSYCIVIAQTSKLEWWNRIPTCRLCKYNSHIILIFVIPAIFRAYSYCDINYQTGDEPQKQDTQANKRSPLLSEEVPYQITLIRLRQGSFSLDRRRRESQLDAGTCWKMFTEIGEWLLHVCGLHNYCVTSITLWHTFYTYSTGTGCYYEPTNLNLRYRNLPPTSYAIVQWFNRVLQYVHSQFPIPWALLPTTTSFFF